MYRCCERNTCKFECRKEVMGFTTGRSIRRCFRNAKITYSNLLVLLFVQFLFKFSQGQGPGDDPNHFTVKENQPAGTEVGRIPVQDFYNYTFSEDSNAKSYFNLDENTGRITTKIIIDREAVNLPDSQFNILVLAQSTSGAKSPIEISIQILDENDNSPVFPSAVVSESFRESSPIGSQKYIAQAVDQDIGQNALITEYKIVSGDGPFKLVFNPAEFGEVLIIQTTGVLDREIDSSFTLVISAQDQGSPPKSGTTILNITIIDENDNPPIFDPSTFSASVNETDPIGTFIIKVNATDRDDGINKDVTYRIVDDNVEAEQFEIELTTGSIYTKTQPLVCQQLSQCLLTVEATDGGMPSYSGRAFVYITVLDVNNHDPEIVIKYVPSGNMEYSSINEDAHDKEIVAGIQASDKDSGVFGKTSVRIISGNELRHFIFESSPVPELYFVRVNGDGVLDRERHHLYNLSIEATDSGNPPRTSTASLVIYVNDINDHAPVFVNSRVKLSLSETMPIHAFVASMLAVDKDTGINAKLTYTILTGNDLGWFHINPNTGLVTTQKQLHYEIQHYFVMNISVHDGALNPFYDYSELEITLWDENDMAPMFVPTQVYNVTLEENLKSVAPVVTAAAVDNDSGANGTITYEFHPYVQLHYPDKFFIHSDTGEVTTRKLLDREEVVHYTIYVIAKDQGRPARSSTATINLEITDVNDNAPVFYPIQYYAKIIEGQSQGHEVVMVTATDLDAGNNGKISYSLSSSNEINLRFQINANTGVITTKTVLQKNDGSSFTLTVFATDQPGRRSQVAATVSVSVMSVTDSPPYFRNNEYTFQIAEDPGNSGSLYVGGSVGTVEAISASPGTSILYQIVAGDPADLFSLGRSSGKITRAKSIDREIYPHFILEVVATAGEMFVTTRVNIKVTDSNDNPPSFTYPVLEIDLMENWPVGHHIHRVSASDPDEAGPNSRIVYSLQNDHNNVFKLQPDTGVLILNKPIRLLGTSSVSLTVRAMDSAAQPLTTTQELRLSVKDINDHSPKFPHTTYELSLIESTAVNTQFFNVQATDDDFGDNAALLLNITRGNEDGKFEIFPDGNLFIAKELDRETKDLYKLTVRAMDKGQPPRSAECNITIHISDYNDNKPIFLNATYSFNVPENKQKGTFVGYVKASDNDMGRNAELLYYFQGPVDGFNIDPQTGEITTSQSFDREALKEIDYTVIFDVIAKDNGQIRLENIATVRVGILDENDNPPLFRQAVYKVTVFENAAVFSNVTVVKADDPDFGVNSILTYRIIDGNNDNNFLMNPTTGQIMLQRALDRETQDFYEIQIEATDTGDDVRYSATTVVKITVMDINDNFPLFPQTHLDISVREDKPLGALIAHFPATDIDLGVNGEITYSMSGIDDDGTFGIDHHTGKIYLKKPLNYEAKQSYRLNVTATDNGVPKLPYYIRFSITIEDVNDNYPQFQNEPLSFRIVEHSSNIQVSTVRAIDIDSGKNGEVQYSLAYQDPPGDLFKIVKNTGLIYLDKQVDREVTALYTLMVVATDQAEDVSLRLSSQTQVLIEIEDENDNSPMITSFDTLAVPRLTPKNEFLTTIKAYDPDIGVNGQISLQLIQGGSMFGLESQSGRFYLAQALPDTPVKYLLKVQVNDYGVSRRTTQFDLNVIVTNDSQGPVFSVQSYSGQVVENSDAGTNILTVDAVSRLNSNVEYYVTNITHVATGKEAGRYFKVDRSTGVLSTAAVLDREEVGSEFDVEIYAIDADGSSPQTSFVKARIQLTDVNDTPPSFEKNFYSIDVREDIQVDTTITTLLFSDKDSLGGLKLTLNPTGSTNIEIDQNGSLITTGPLDRESQPRYTLIVTATDGIQSASCQVRINLLDVNDNSPIFSEPFYSIDVDEDTALGTTIGGVQADDPDQGQNGQVTFFMASAWANDTFYLDPVLGTLVLRNVIDFEQSQLYTLVVRAKDSGNPGQTSSVTVYINVQDVNDNTPLFEHGIYEPAVFENVTIGTSVVQVLATDIDSGVNGEVEYSIVDGDIEEAFRIDPDDGTIYTRASLDRETTPSYSLTVIARDKAINADKRRSSNTEVMVSLRDVNDFTPEIITPAVIHALENLPRNTVVHTVGVRDLDEGINGEIRYSISSQTGGTPFTIGQNDGQLRVNAVLDRETVQNYSLVIMVSDKGVPPLSASQTMMVIVDDENDNAPVFNPSVYTNTIAENTAVGSTLLQVTATDQDAGLNGIVSYFIVAGDDNFDFYLDQSSGVLRVQKSLDYERVKKYDLTIQAEDSADDTRYANATITVTILDVNDNKPVFLDSPYIGFVRENMEVGAVHVLQVSAYDADSYPFNQLNYMIREGDQDLFNMSQTSGEIMALKVLDREEMARYTLTVVATDSTTGRGLTGSGTVSVYVEDVNDNPPIFEHNGTYIAHIAEDVTVNTEVIVIKATDDDEGVNAQIIYSLSDSVDQDVFTIYPDTGVVSTQAVLDRETVAQYTLEIIAKDVSMLPLSSTTTLVVYVDDVNDNPPVFEQESYSRTMLAPASSGDFVCGVTASDMDVGDNGLIVYALSGPDSSSYRIDSVTGVITVTQSLTQGKTYSLNIIATDKGSPQMSATVTVGVSVVSSSSTPPTFNTMPDDIRLKENAANLITVTTVSAVPSVTNARVTYKVAGGNVGQAFGIDSSTGRIYVSGALDYEVTKEFHLWVEAIQAGSTSVSNFGEVVIIVDDVNDNVPKFSQPFYNMSIMENYPLGSSLESVVATDPDSGNNGIVMYSLSGVDKNLFRIDKTSGQIVTFTTLDREQLDTYSLIVVATDQGNPALSSTASVRVNVLDVNDNSPAFTRQFRIKIPENLKVGSFVIQVTSTDNDIGENAVARYSFADDADGTFIIEPISGNISLNKPLDAERNQSYNLRVSATDGANVILGNVEVEISDVNDNSPIIVEPYTFNFPEMSPPGTFIGQLSATDSDVEEPNNQVYFALKLASGFFQLDSDTGRISSLEKLYFDSAVPPTSPPNRHELVVVARDLGTPAQSSEVTIHINVMDYNDHAPQFEQSSYRSAVPDDAVVESSIIQVVAKDDLDYGDNAKVEYFLTGGNGQSLFHVNRFTGVVSVGSSLAGYKNRDYNITVKAEDKGSPPQYSTVDVHLSVTDINVHPPVFQKPGSRETTISEDIAVGTLIETFLASDADYGMNAEVFYKITSGNEEDLFDLNMDSGNLTCKKQLDYEKAHQHTLSITASDRALKNRETTINFVIKLSDINDNDPIFATSMDKVFVEENAQVGLSIYQAIASDADSGIHAKIHFALVGNAEAQGKFSIDDETGIVTVKGDLDYETKDEYHLTIMSLNPDSSRKSTMSLTVHIEGVNEFVPSFIKDTYYFSISESAPTKTSVGFVSATDDDAGQDGIVFYFLIGDSNAKGFKIDSRTGIVSVSAQPDYENSNSITLKVLAKNWGSVKGNDTDSCVVHISVEDANDAPRFVKDVYTANIMEKSGPGTSVITVSAEDTDFQISDRTFSYLILSGNIGNAFRIDSQSGYISTTGNVELDREVVAIYNLTVGAKDTGTPPQTGSALVEVHLDPFRAICGATYCQNGGSCVNNVCQCPSTWTGPGCAMDVNECESQICREGSTCQNTPGSFICHCPNGLTGTYCENVENFCKSSPCERGDCENSVTGYICVCPYGFWGPRCQFTSTGFSVGSYMEFPTIIQVNEVTVVFATFKSEALLMYNPSSIAGSTEFIALEVINGQVVFSIAVRNGNPVRVLTSLLVNTGDWYKVKITRDYDVYRLEVQKCPEDRGVCDECLSGSCVSQGQIPANQQLDLGSHPLTLGGIQNMSTILTRANQVASHDFVGCIQTFSINNVDMLQETPTMTSGEFSQCPRTSGGDVCSGYSCMNGGTCTSQWEGPVCRCTSRYSGNNCEQELQPFGFTNDAFVKVSMKESARRDAQLSALRAERRRRAVTESMLMVRFRITTDTGVLVFASTTDGQGSKYSLLSVIDGRLTFSIYQYDKSESVSLETPTVSDGNWRNATVTITETNVQLALDDRYTKTLSQPVFMYSSLDVKEITLGGSPSAVSIGSKSLKDFDGCISVFHLDGKELPMNGTSDRYNIEVVGSVSNGCLGLCGGGACDGNVCTVNGEAVTCSINDEDDSVLSIGIIVVIVFFILVLIGIIVVFIVFKHRRRMCMKAKEHTKQNGANVTSKSANSSGHSHQDSGYGENNIDELIIRNHIAQELAHNKFHSPNGRLKTPDIIETDISRHPMPLEMEDGTVIIDNASDLTHLRDLNGDMPEHYDLENASSIAPSDIDIADHYRHFHDGGRHRRKNKSHSNHSHSNSQHSSRHQSNHNSQHSHMMRDSPNLLTSVPYLNDLARTSPNPRSSHSPVNPNVRHSPNVRQSPLANMNMKGYGMPVTDLNNGSRTQSERSLASHRSKSSTPNKPKRQMLPNGPQKKISNNNYENKQFLTLEEIERLNARTRQSPASMQEAMSSSSENNTRKMQKPYNRFQDTNVLLEPPESSSDDSANDSFTCSEFEYDNDKQKNDFDPTQRIFSNLPEVENEVEDGAYHNKTFKSDGLDSGGNSFSSNMGSSDESKPQSTSKNNAFNWDDLLNWGPKFEKLVGVFTDIALLPDADSPDFGETEGKAGDNEEYV